MLRDLLWPFCGWRPFRSHDLYFGRVLTVTAEAICRNCGRRWMVHEHQPGMLAWSDEVEAFFRRRVSVAPTTDPPFSKGGESGSH